MDSTTEVDSLLVQRIRQGDSQAWDDLIGRYEGRLLAFVDSRIGNRTSAEDIVQEAFIGFLNSLPNYDGSRPLESYLFSICAYKLTDHLRREGRRPTIPLSSSGGDQSGGGSGRAEQALGHSHDGAHQPPEFQRRRHAGRFRRGERGALLRDLQRPRQRTQLGQS